MAPTTTTGPRPRILGILGVAALALVILASGALAQSPAGSPTPAEASTAPALASPAPDVMSGGRRIVVCPRVRRGDDRWQRRDRRTLRAQVRERQRDLRRAIRDPRGAVRERRRAIRDPRRRSDERSMRQRRIASARIPGSVVRAATVSAVEGTGVTLVTADGWSRTVDTTAIPITRGGATISAADLRVDDRVRVAQRRAGDGSWQVTRLQVLLASVRGTVASVNGDGFEVTTPDGGSVSVRVSGTTRWVLGCAIDPATPLEAGARVVVRGVRAADGSLEATQVAATGPARQRPARRGRSVQPPAASPAPSASPAATALPA